MALTYSLISSATVGSGGTSNIEFTSIPQTYTDLVLKLSLRDTLAQVKPVVRIVVNNNTNLIYNSRNLESDNGTIVGRTDTNNNYLKLNNAGNGSLSESNTFCNIELYFHNYAGSSNKNVSISSVAPQNNSNTITLMLQASRIDTSTAITSIKMESQVSYAQYSTAYLYGVKTY